MTSSVATRTAMHAREGHPSPRDGARFRSPVAEVLQSIRFATRMARSLDESRARTSSTVVPSDASTVTYCGSSHSRSLSPAKSCCSAISGGDGKSKVLSLTQSELENSSNISAESIAAVPARAVFPSKLSSGTDSGSMYRVDAAGRTAARENERTRTPPRLSAPVDTSGAAQRIRMAFRDIDEPPRGYVGSHGAPQRSRTPANKLKFRTPEGQSRAAALVELQTAIAILRDDCTPIPVHTFLPPIKTRVLAPAATTPSQNPSSRHLSEPSTFFQEPADSDVSLSTSLCSVSISTPWDSSNNNTPMTPTHEIGPSTAFHDNSASTSAFFPGSPHERSSAFSQMPSQGNSSAALNPSSRRPSAAGSLDGLTSMATSMHVSVNTNAHVNVNNGSRIPVPRGRTTTASGTASTDTCSSMKSLHIPRLQIPKVREDQSTQMLPPETVRDIVFTAGAGGGGGGGLPPPAPSTFFGLNADTTQFSLKSNPLHSPRRASLRAVEEAEGSAPVMPAVRNAPHYRPSSSQNMPPSNLFYPANQLPASSGSDAYGTVHSNPFFQHEELSTRGTASTPVATPPQSPPPPPQPYPHSSRRSLDAATSAGELEQVHRKRCMSAATKLQPGVKATGLVGVVLPPPSSSSSMCGSSDADGPLAPPSSSNSSGSSAPVPPGCSALGFSGISSGFFRNMGGASSHMHGGVSTGVHRVRSLPPQKGPKPQRRLPQWMSQPLRGGFRSSVGHVGAGTPVAIAENDVATGDSELLLQGDFVRPRKIRSTASRAGRSMKLMVWKAASVCAEQARRMRNPFSRR